MLPTLEGAMSRTKYPVPVVARFLLCLLLVVYAVLMLAGLVVAINFGSVFPLIYCILSVWGVWMTSNHLIWGHRPTVQLVERTSSLDITAGSAGVTTFRSNKKKLKWSAPYIVLLPLVLAASFTVCCLPIGFFVQLVG